ncbi:MAG: extracellular solute-binding protein [Fimbriimonadaceae bacterium]|nr:extracellular solute-binding protein [Fimbriimonadaceae bacterium]
MNRWRTLWLLPFLLPGCGKPGPPAADQPAAVAPERQQVVVYSPHGKEMLEPFEKRFEADHPEIDLEWTNLGSQEVLDRLRAERANPVADVWWGAPHTMFRKAAADGLLAPYRPTWADQAQAARHDAEDRWYGQYLTPAVIVYNSDALTAQQAPQDWDDLLDARWQGKILIRHPLGSGTMRSFFAAMILRAKTVDAGFDWLRKLHLNTKAYPANPALLHRQMATREGLVTIWALRDVEIQKRSHHYPLGYVVPRSGCPTVLDALAMVQGARHPEAARTFYEYVTAPAQMLWAAEQFDCMPATPGVEAARLPARMPRKIQQMPLDWDVVEREGAGWMDRWDRTVRSVKVP